VFNILLLAEHADSMKTQLEHVQNKLWWRIDIVTRGWLINPSRWSKGKFLLIFEFLGGRWKTLTSIVYKLFMLRRLVLIQVSSPFIRLTCNYGFWATAWLVSSWSGGNEKWLSWVNYVKHSFDQGHLLYLTMQWLQSISISSRHGWSSTWKGNSLKAIGTFQWPFKWRWKRAFNSNQFYEQSLIARTLVDHV
jgi:hypothetical protein